MAKAKKKSFFVFNKSVQTSVMAVILVVTIPALYIILFVAKADKELRGNVTTTIQGYASQETCEMESEKDCYEVTTVQEDRYFVPQQ